MCQRHHAFPSSFCARASGALICLIGAVSSVAGIESDASAQEAPAGASVTPPVVIQHVDAEYPRSALPERKHADVVVAVTVDVDGHVSKVDVLQSGGADLDEAATVAVRQWVFTPAMRGGKAVASRIKVPFHFAPPAPAPRDGRDEDASGPTPGLSVVPKGAAPAVGSRGPRDRPAAARRSKRGRHRARAPGAARARFVRLQRDRR